jgi:hypothetical protein
VDRVVFEPNEAAPARIRVFGAFAFVDGSASRPMGVTEARRGVLAFSMPVGTGPQRDSTVAVVRREWSDLKSVAGTGQAVGFGSWRYFGQFSAFKPDGRGANAPQAMIAEQNVFGEFRVSAVADSLAAVAVVYTTETGVVRLTEASHRSVIAMLRAAR